MRIIRGVRYQETTALTLKYICHYEALTDRLAITKKKYYYYTVKIVLFPRKDIYIIRKIFLEMTTVFNQPPSPSSLFPRKKKQV